MKNKLKKSFYDWCLENNRQDMLNSWDTELNKSYPSEISYGTRKEYYFKCPRGIHKSELRNINTLTTNNRQLKCNECNSFAQYNIDNICEDFLEKYWDYEKNTINPWKVGHSSEIKIWIKCQEKDYHESYKVRCDNFSLNIHRCPYCSGKQVNLKDSFAQWGIDNVCSDFLEKYWSNMNTINPWQISKSSSKKVLIKCQEKDYHDDYTLSCFSFFNGDRCPYCSNHKTHFLDSLGTIFPEVILLWSDKNKKSPYEYAPMSNQKVWWKCPNNKHEDYFRTINTSIVSDFRCPSCTRERNESFLQEKVRLYITEQLKYKTNHERNCTIVPQNPKVKNRHGELPFDNEIINLKLIIEVNGGQHYDICAYTKIWKSKTLTPEEQLYKRKLYDRYKRYIAYLYGYYYLEIPYWLDDKKESWKKLIDAKISEIFNKQ